MAHDHDHAHVHAHGTGGSIRAAFFLNLAFTIAELIGGWWTKSMAITADALHGLGDSVSLGLAWVLERVAGREARALLLRLPALLATRRPTEHGCPHLSWGL